MSDRETEDKQNVDALLNLLHEIVSDPGINDMVHKSYLYRILLSIYINKSKDPDVLTQDIYNAFDHALPINHIRDIVEHHLSEVLTGSGFFDADGVMTVDAVEFCKKQAVMLGYTVKTPTLN